MQREGNHREFEWVPCQRPNQPGAYFKCPHGNFWSRVGIRLLLYILHRQRAGGTTDDTELAQLATQAGEHMPQLISQSGLGSTSLSSSR